MHEEAFFSLAIAFTGDTNHMWIVLYASSPLEDLYLWRWLHPSQLSMFSVCTKDNGDSVTLSYHTSLKIFSPRPSLNYI